MKSLLAQGKSPVNGPHQGALVDTPTGDNWFLHFQDVDAYGRIVHLQPVRWENDWPLMGTGVATGAGVDADDSVWERTWSVNVMGSVYAARALLAHATPERRSRLLVTASAAGLLTNLGDAPYSVTKHGAVALAEWLAIHHHDDGLDVLLLCPQGVRTPMVTDGLAAAGPGAVAAEVVESLGLIEPAACADAVAEGLADDRFLILPHPEVADYAAARARDPQRWIAGMRRLLARLSAAPNP